MTSPEAAWARASEIGQLVTQRVSRLQQAFLHDDMTARADLAHLRHALGKPPGALPETWALTIDGLDAIEHPPNEGPSPSEHAVHLAMTLYALHQRGRGEAVHRPGRSYGLGDAGAQLRGGGDDTAVIRRFAALTTSISLDEFAYHLRSLVSQLGSIALDYGDLARDLYLIQHSAQADAVRLRWARGFERRPNTAEDASRTAHTTSEKS